MSSAPPVPPRLRRSRHLSWFGHMGAVYLFHDLYGYLMEMSPDIAAMIQSFDDGVDTEETIAYYRGKFEDADPRQFVEVLVAHAVLVDPAEDEVEGLWAFVPLKGKWNVWRRRDDRLTLWTAWGDRPVQQLFFDPDETRMWDAFDGNTRLVEMRHHHDNGKLLALVRRLVHNDAQALKLSVMPWSVYAKRPALAPAYLASTMPYPRWTPGTPVPEPVALADYHRETIGDADAQFDHQETTLSHLLRVPHPALRGRTYGQALIDVLIARDQIPDGRVRVLEIGAGLGYVARDAIARLRAAGREVEYTIVELSPALAAAQRARIGDAATWISGDVLEVALPDAAFDLVISNEMAGDLPARKLTRADLGLAADAGTVDRDRLRALGGGAAYRAGLGVGLDDA
ncbi:MAG: SAM-dependent methyltransferase, partial [Kofleriaceae bacterium]